MELGNGRKGAQNTRTFALPCSVILVIIQRSYSARARGRVDVGSQGLAAR